ncbi:hypothetical protein C9374_006090 [Naegleria lovaniensis]|uniref:Uncharacterized protein n=1 Tax=Naegleria lovaniensis TaxID=51637 RepID=A0AA88GIP8_NAELO|nr:uncharacterized protein C9374_006090 [Naegleria lovaniensis]KAG2381706.1 hypothetical protein C9374_006090 [Naegleria lovaniensis]
MSKTKSSVILEEIHEESSSHDDDDDIPDYSQWSFKKETNNTPINLLSYGRDQASEENDEEKDEEIPNYSNWSFQKEKRQQPNVRKFVPVEDEEVQEEHKEPLKDKLSDQLQQSLAKFQKSSDDEEFSFIPKKQQKPKNKPNIVIQKDKNKYDFSDILYNLDEDEESDTDTETLSYEEWKQRQEFKTRNKGPFDLLESLKKMSDSISPLDKPLNPQMTEMEHKLMLEWMFPICKYKQK